MPLLGPSFLAPFWERSHIGCLRKEVLAALHSVPWPGQATLPAPIRDGDECKPYMYAQNILGSEHPQFGLARNNWLTGTALWACVAATQYILGTRPIHRGQEIGPFIPPWCKGFRAKRAFHDAVHESGPSAQANLDLLALLGVVHLHNQNILAVYVSVGQP